MINDQDRETLRDLLVRESPSTILQILAEEAARESCRLTKAQAAEQNRLNYHLSAQLNGQIVRMRWLSSAYSNLTGTATRIEQLSPMTFGIPPAIPSDGAVQMSFL